MGILKYKRIFSRKNSITGISRLYIGLIYEMTSYVEIWWNLLNLYFYAK